MSLGLAISLMGIALLDSLNPSLFAAQFYLFTSPKPVLRTVVYILGILFVMLLGGILILNGLLAAIETLLRNTDARILLGLQALIGLIILIFGLRASTSSMTTTEGQKPRSQKLIHAFALGIVVMGNELTTALPYFIALEQIAQAKMSFMEIALALLLYNLIFSLPLFAFLLVFVRLRERFKHFSEKISARLNQWMPYVIKYASIGFGAFLLLHATFVQT